MLGASIGPMFGAVGLGFWYAVSDR
jgi:hypothetical protein